MTAKFRISVRDALRRETSTRDILCYLHAEDISIKELSEKLNVPNTTMYHWINSERKVKEERDQILRNSIDTVYGNRLINIEIDVDEFTQHFDEMTKELGPGNTDKVFLIFVRYYIKSCNRYEHSLLLDMLDAYLEGSKV